MTHDTSASSEPQAKTLAKGTTRCAAPFAHDDPGSNTNTAITAALPRSPLHLRFLVNMTPLPDIIFYRDAHLFDHMSPAIAERAHFLGREQRWPGKTNLLATRRANAHYYANVRALLSQYRYHRLILFLESEPLENLVRDFIGDERIELWEEGLSHYTDFHGKLYDILRSSLQWLCGFYAPRILERRADRTRFLAVRDRYSDGSLTAYCPPPDAHIRYHDACLFIGAPLVQDRLVSKRRYLAALERIIAAARQPLVYYPHPREDVRPLRDLERAFGTAWFRIAPNAADVANHCTTNRYQAYLAAFSTALLDVAEDGFCTYIPAFFGLRRVNRRLRTLTFLPVRLISKPDDLVEFFETAQVAALKHGSAHVPTQIETPAEVA